MHSKKHGKSGSHRPPGRVAPAWVDYSANEIEEAILKMAKEGTAPAMIGLELRDSYGVPSVKSICGKSVTQILNDNKALPEYPDDIINLIKRAVGMRKHLKTNKSDGTNRTKLTHVEAKIKRLVKYYTKTGRMPPTWKYDPEKAALLVK